MKNRGLYHGAQGDERRQSSAAVAEQLDINDTIEGHEISVLRRMLGEQAWTEITAYCASLKAKGFAQFRIDSMMNRASCGIKF